MKPWNAANANGRITRPLRHNGQPYSGMNVLLLWSEGMARGFSSPTWMTFKQALELGSAVRKGETGATVVFASRFTKSETDGKAARSSGKSRHHILAAIRPSMIGFDCHCCAGRRQTG
jgi:antirestriction protein ArdC